MTFINYAYYYAHLSHGKIVACFLFIFYNSTYQDYPTKMPTSYLRTGSWNTLFQTKNTLSKLVEM